MHTLTLPGIKNQDYIHIQHHALTNALRCVKTLESEIRKCDAQYDLCNEAWARGEVSRFSGSELLDPSLIQTT